MITELATLENQAIQRLKNIRNEWIAFCQIVETIKTSGLWQAKSRTWSAYCRDTFGVSDSRIRQHLSAHELSQSMESMTGIPLSNERQARLLRQSADTPDKQAQIHVLAHHAATELDEPIAKRHYDAVTKVIDELTVTSGNVSIDGVQVPVRTTPDTLALAVVTEAREATKRHKEYKSQGLQDAPVIVMQIGDKAYAVLHLDSDYPIKLLEGYVAKVPKPKAAEMDKAG